MRVLVRALLIFFAIISAAPALAASHGAQLQPGRVQLNVGGTELIAADAVNVFKMALVTYSNSIDAGIFDADGYPVRAPVGTVTYSWGGVSSFNTWGNVTYEMAWPATRTFTFPFSSAMSGCTVISGAATITGCTGGIATIASQSGQPGVVQFTLGSGSRFSITLTSGGNFAAGSGEIALYRLSDKSAYQAATYWTPEFEAVTRNGREESLRTMGWTMIGSASNSCQAKWAYRTHPTSFTWGKGGTVPPGIWGGAISGTDAYTIGAAPDTNLGAWAQREMIIGSLTNSATKITISGAVSNGGNVKLTTGVGGTGTLSPGQQVWIANVVGTTEANGTPTILTVDDATHFTINVPFVNAYVSGGNVGTQTLTITGKSGGKKFISNSQGLIPLSSFDSMTGNTVAVFVYDSVLDRVMYSVDNCLASVPIEAKVQLGNDARVGIWDALPIWADDDYATHWATAALGLNPDLPFHPSTSNEVWNFSYPQTNYSIQMGLAFGFPNTNNEPNHGYYGLRVRQVMGNIVGPIWAAAGRSSQLDRMLEFQAGGDTTILTYRMQGHDLAPSGTHTGTGNAAYVAFTIASDPSCAPAGCDYTQKPNRPEDVIESIAGAPYIGGTNLCEGPDIGCTPDASNAAFFQSLVTAWESGDSATSISLIDNDIRSGRTSPQTVTCSGTTFTTPLAHGFTANSSLGDVVFTVAGGTLYSGLALNTLYRVTSTPTSATFMMQPYVNGFPSGSNVNCGSAGSGTVSVGLSRFKNMVNVSNTWYPFFEFLAASADGDRPAGMANLKTRWYEGAIEPVGLTTAQCTSLGITGTDCAGSITAAAVAWRNDPASAATVQTYYKQFMGLDPAMLPTFGLMAHAASTSQLVLLGPSNGTNNPWPFISNGLPNSPPYQLYNGASHFSLGLNFLLKRDLDPAANDNTPMFLNRAA